MKIDIPSHFLFGFLLVAYLSVNISSCLAQEAPLRALSVPMQTPGEQRGEAPSIIIDPDANAFRFFIDGKEVARIDQTGLHVRQDVAYGGAITDTGTEAYDKQAADRGAAQ